LKFWTGSKVPVPENQVLTVYRNSGHVGIHLPNPPADALLIGREANNDTHYVLVQQGERYVLWGFTGSPEQMTDVGRRLFVHTCRYTESLTDAIGGGKRPRK
jgi:hypothetical protein